MIRITRQREAMLKVLARAGRPLSVQELFELAREDLPTLGLRTVFRNIREMVREGQLIGIDYPGQPMRYEKNSGGGHYPHFICRKCDKVYVWNIDVPEVTVNPPAQFAIEGQEIIFFGTCPDCQFKLI
jgi:Fur family ferric uptake transcriptional regulator